MEIIDWKGENTTNKKSVKYFTNDTFIQLTAMGTVSFA